VRNTGGAFGIFGGERGGLGSVLFVVVSLIAIGIIVYLFIKLQESERILAFSFSFILSGAMGNLIDRLHYGEVIDFLQFYLSFLPWRIFNPWPTFNIADSAICVGIGLLALEILIRDSKKSTQ
jgi:signal peptidase II